MTDMNMLEAINATLLQKLKGEFGVDVAMDVKISGESFLTPPGSLSDLVAAGVKLSVGVDSHILTSPLEDLRCVELGERLRTGRRNVLRFEDRGIAEALWHIGSHVGAQACGFEDAGAGARTVCEEPADQHQDAAPCHAVGEAFDECPARRASRVEPTRALRDG